MLDIFKINPIAIRHCILYEFLRGNPVEHTLTALKVIVGSDVVKNEEFYIWFDRFHQEMSDVEYGERSITDMRKVIQSDKYALRACVLYESLKYKLILRGSPSLFLWLDISSSDNRIRYNPSFFMYNNFCEVIGDGVMEYQEFDFWFYLFLNGDSDLKYERNKDKKIYELSDMPIDVMENIVKNLDIFNRINLAKTSRSLQTFVENQKVFHYYLKLHISHTFVIVSFGNSVYITYSREGKDCVKKCKKHETIIPNVSYWEQAILDLKSFLKNPKLYLCILEIESEVDNEHVFDDLEDAFKFTHHLNVRSLILRGNSSDKIPNIIPSLKPGFLAYIQNFLPYTNEDSMRKVFETEQWKQAKYFKLIGFFIWPLRHLYHFNEFHVGLKELSVEDIRQMKETLFKSPLQTCSIMFNNDNVAEKIEKVFRYSTWLKPNTPGDMKIYHYSIQNSSDYFEIEAQKWAIKITRKKR